MTGLKTILSFMIAFLAISVFGQDPEFTASSNTSAAAVGQQIQVSYKLKNGNASRLQKPDFSNFQYLGMQQSSGGGMTVIVNGKVVQGGESEQTWTFFLMPIKEGKFKIPPAKARVNGKWIQSNSVDIEVYPGNQPPPQQNQSSNQQATPPSAGEDKDVFIRAYVNKKNPYQGEQVIVTYKIYTSLPIKQYGISKQPSHNGFWSEEITKQDARPTQKNETINGKQYISAEIFRTILFPQKSGELTIDPMEVEAIAQIKSKTQSRYRDPFFDQIFNDPFFNRHFQNYQDVKKILKSNPIKIKVKPLPSVNKPAGFNNTVGNFKLEASIDKEELKANEAVNLKVKISGQGNLKLIEEPEFNFPPDFEVYDPKISNKVTTTTNGVSGSKTFEYILQPRNPGKYTIDPYSFSYFDVASKTYKILSTPEFKLNVLRGDGTEAEVVVSGKTKESIKYLGNDIRFIKTEPFTLTVIGNKFFGSVTYYILLFIPVLAFIILMLVYKEQLKRKSNIALMKNKKATKVARKRLKTAKTHLDNSNKEAFYEEISQALWGYLSDKLTIPMAELSTESVQVKLVDNSVSEETTTQFSELLNNCEFARFAPDSGGTGMDKTYNEAITIISKIENELKL